MSLTQSKESRQFAIRSTLSLAKDPPTNPSVKRRALFDEMASAPIREPLNREETLYSDFLSVLQRRGIPVSNILQEQSPYWMPDTPYDMMEVVGTAVQFTDQHAEPLPKTTLPPAHDLETFIDRVLQEPGIVTKDREFDILLNITGNNIVGAANLGMMADRFMARFADQRAYPSLTIQGKEYTKETADGEIDNLMREWNTKVARFEAYHPLDTGDGARDGYYFWTHVFAGALLNSTNDLRAQALQRVFAKGTELMIFVKYSLARRKGVVSNHRMASELGRVIGLSLSEEAKEDNQQQNSTPRRDRAAGKEDLVLIEEGVN